jgi:hypothetical protein
MRGPTTITCATLVLAALLSLLAASAPAQTPFASQALGQNVQTGTARDTGRGGWGMADSDTLVPGTLNSAALADLRFAGLVFSGYGETTATDDGDQTRTTRRTLLPNVRVAAPLRAGRLVLHAGFDVRRSMHWQAEQTFSTDQFGREVAGLLRNEREGTLFAIPIGLSWRATDALALGVTANLMRGSIDELLTELHADSLGTYASNLRDQKDELSGSNVTLSALWTLSSRLALGASYTPGWDLEFDRTTSLGGVGERARSTRTGSMPAEYRAGLVLGLGERWRFGADGQLARLSEFDGRPEWEPILRDEWTVSAGLERPLVRAERGRGYTPPLRLGFQWRHWAHAVGGPPVHERTISAGTGFPFRNRMGMIDLSLSYSWVGDRADNGVEASTWRLGVSITGLERLVF